ncbi:hypothetical protein AB0G05_04405 [Nonomuraea wenchangensis]
MPAHTAGFPATFLDDTPAPAVAATMNSSRGGGVGAPLDPTAALGWALQRQAVLLYATRSGLFSSNMSAADWHQQQGWRALQV